MLSKTIITEVLVAGNFDNSALQLRFVRGTLYFVASRMSLDAPDDIITGLLWLLRTLWGESSSSGMFALTYFDNVQRTEIDDIESGQLQITQLTVCKRVRKKAFDI